MLSKPLSEYKVDVPDGVSDHLEPIIKAEGGVLINGLGPGMVLKVVLEKPEVVHVDIVENSPDVMTLVAPSYDDVRVTFHLADAFEVEWPKEDRWDVVWHDIWPNLCRDNLKEMSRLKRKYAKRCTWQGCWGEEYTRRMR